MLLTNLFLQFMMCHNKMTETLFNNFKNRQISTRITFFVSNSCFRSEVKYQQKFNEKFHWNTEIFIWWFESYNSFLDLKEGKKFNYPLIDKRANHHKPILSLINGSIIVNIFMQIW